MQKNEEFKRAKIVSTLGPVSRNLETLEQLFLNGVNVFRMNFSHSSYEEHAETYANIRAIAKKYNKSLAILADMQGPKLRVGKFKEEKVFLEEGQKFILDMKDDLGDATRACLPHPQIFEALKEGDFLLVDDGKVKLEVQTCNKEYAETKVVVSGYISNNKGVNYPSGVLKLSALTEKDLKDLEFALDLGVDYIALSFVQLAEDVEYAKSLINGRAKLISKIEKPSAVDNIAKIIEASDGVMVARGDLGVELPAEIVPTIQLSIIREARRQSKPVIVATQMLESMISSPVATRAEVSDVATAIYQGADAVMLSGETAVGKYPVEAVKTMAKIIKEVEKDNLYWEGLYNSNKNIHNKYFIDHPEDKVLTVGRSIAVAAIRVSESINAKAVVTFSFMGTTVNRVSHQKPHAKILGLTDSSILYNQMSLNWGVTPLLIDKVVSFSEVLEISQNWLKENNWVKSGDKVVMVAGIPINIGGITNSIRVIVID